jgi:hypothetical protein
MKTDYPCTLITRSSRLWVVREERSVSLVYSPDDGGYYFEMSNEGEEVTSNVFPTLYEATTAYRTKRETLFNGL